MASLLKPSEEIQVAGLSAAIVYGIFALNAPNLADVRYDVPGNKNTYKAVNDATWTSTVVIGAIALLAKSPTIWIVGGGMILLETWKHHYANFGVHGAQDNSINNQKQM
jgi:hypothetical protein